MGHSASRKRASLRSVPGAVCLPLRSIAQHAVAILSPSPQAAVGFERKCMNQTRRHRRPVVIMTNLHRYVASLGVPNPQLALVIQPSRPERPIGFQGQTVESASENRALSIIRGFAAGFMAAPCPTPRLGGKDQVESAGLLEIVLKAGRPHHAPPSGWGVFDVQ